MIDKNELGINDNVIKELGLEIANNNNILEIKVSSFSTFDYLLSVMNNPDNRFKVFKRFYRGVTDKYYDLKPSIAVKGLNDVEPIIINRFYLSSPESFTKYSSNFDRLALMQHYGLPTRLLDFTKNPFVAAWFACQENKKQSDAAIYVAFSNMKSSCKFVEIVCNIAFQDMDIFDTKGLQSFLSNSDLRYYLSCLDVGSFYNFIEAPAFDQREKNQQSVFLLGINRPILINGDNSESMERIEFSSASLSKFFDFVDNKTPSFENRIIPGDIMCYKEDDRNFLLKIIIPNSLKKSFLKEIEIRGITEEFIFPSLDNYAKRIVNDFINDKEYYKRMIHS